MYQLLCCRSGLLVPLLYGHLSDLSPEENDPSPVAAIDLEMIISYVLSCNPRLFTVIFSGKIKRIARRESLEESDAVRQHMLFEGSTVGYI